MTYKSYSVVLGTRIACLFLSLLGLAFAIPNLDFETNLIISSITIAPLVLLVIILIRNLYKFSMRRYAAMNNFFESVKYRDFSQWFNETSGPEDIKILHRGFNTVNETIKKINKDKEAQYLYLQKILEIVDTGIVAYNTNTRDVLWINDKFKETLNIPTLKNIHFVAKRNPKMFTDVFETDHLKGNTISLDAEQGKIKVLISSSFFKIDADEFKLIVLQNIEHTLNQNQSEAWHKLLSVMTHEIMNSIAPISSLAETLQSKIKMTQADADINSMEMVDIYTGIESIRKRSEGLMKFAKTYRGLNKITTLNASDVFISELFENISNLLQPSLKKKKIELQFVLENPKLQINIDNALIEQVLINLILNAIEASKHVNNPTIKISAKQSIEGLTIIKIFDNGKGISNEIIDQVFIPFFSTKKNGSGIGLPFCQQIMFLHKGEIKIKSVENKGTTIQLLFSNKTKFEGNQ